MPIANSPPQVHAAIVSHLRMWVLPLQQVLDLPGNRQAQMSPTITNRKTYPFFDTKKLIF
jgi:hypothetical protein